MFSLPNDLNNNDRLTLLNAHNDKRAQVANGNYFNDQHGFQPGSSNMNSLFWDISLESIAMEYAKKCIKAHNQNRNTDIWNYQHIAGFKYKNSMYIGENWYSSSLKIDEINDPYQPLLNGIDFFFNEITVYNYSKRYQSSAGHYTAIVWANTRYVGCGFNLCHWGTLLVCNYWPAANIPGSYPYQSGITCTQCDNDRTQCIDSKLCGGCMSSSYVASRGTNDIIDECDEIGHIPTICGEAQSDATNESISIKICINLDIQTVDITLIGPSNVWFGVGFDAIQLNNTYSIIIHGNNLNQQTEYILNDWNNATLAPFDGGYGILFVDETEENGVKTVTVTRDRTSNENGVYSFPAIATTIDVIFAKGINTTYPSSILGQFVYVANISLVLDYVVDNISTTITTNPPETTVTTPINIHESECINPDTDTYSIDIILLVDASCGLTSSECSTQQQQISTLISYLKNNQSPRLAYITFWSDNSHNTDTQLAYVTLDNTDYNFDPIQNINQYISLVNTIQCNTNNTDTNVESAIDFAMTHFAIHDIQLQKRLIIFSNCMENQAQSVCDKYSNQDQVKIIIVNNNYTLNSNIYNPYTYLSCLTSSTNTLFAMTHIPQSFNDQFFTNFANAVCTLDTQSPTTQTTQTILPTTQPSKVEGICCHCSVTRPSKTGCDEDPECELYVCGKDIYCCSNEWDEQCAAVAYAKCVTPPTNKPSYEPTPSPIMDAGCREYSDIDLVFLVDNSCGLSAAECRKQQDGIGEFLAHMKFDGEKVAIGYATYDELGASIKIFLGAKPYNDLVHPVNGSNSRIEMAHMIQNLDCGELNGTYTNLAGALHVVMQQINDEDIGRHKKIILFNNCMDNVRGEAYICDEFVNGNGLIALNGDIVETTVVNILNGGGNTNVRADYLQCLANERLIVLEDTEATTFAQSMPKLLDAVCDIDTEAPTSAPTARPTRDPTNRPTTSITTTTQPTISTTTTVEPTVMTTTAEPTISGSTTITLTTAEPTVMTTISTAEPSKILTSEPSSSPSTTTTTQSPQSPTQTSSPTTFEPTIDTTQIVTSLPTIKSRSPTQSRLWWNKWKDSDRYSIVSDTSSLSSSSSSSSNNKRIWDNYRYKRYSIVTHSYSDKSDSSSSSSS